MKMTVYSYGAAGELYQLMCTDCGASFGSKYPDQERCPEHRRKASRASRDAVVSCADCGTSFTTRYPETTPRCGPCGLSALKGS